MKTTGRPPKKTTEKRSSDRKKPETKSFDKPKYSRTSDSKFKKSDTDSDTKKRSYSDKKSFDDNKTSDKRPYRSRDTEYNTSDKPAGRYADKRNSDDKPYSERKPYKSRDTEKPAYDKPTDRYSDRRKRSDDSFSDRKPFKRRDNDSFSERKPYKSKETEKNDSDRPVEKYVDRRKRDDDSFSDRKPFKRREDDNFSERKPYKRRDDDNSSDRKPFIRRDDDNSTERKPYKRRDDDSSSEKRPYKRRDDDSSSDRKPYKRRDDDNSSERRPYKKRDSENGGSDRPVERYSDTRKRDDKSYGDKRPFRSREPKANDNDRPIEKYEDKRFRAPIDYNDISNLSDSDKRKRPRKVESKTYEGKVREYKETEILVKDNTYEKRRSFKTKAKDEGIRLNKYIANAGICSRREADTLIEAGAISINGEIVTQLGTKVMPHDSVKYGDQTLAGEQLQYLLLNKPKGYLTTTDDPQERKTVMQIVEPACKERIYPVGRLDKNTSGLLLFTNDGELAKKLTHPKHMVEKIYHVELDKNLTSTDMKTIADGIELEDGPIKIDAIAYGDTKKEIGIELHSGKNRIVRRIFESLGYDVVKLDRVVFAGLTKKELPRGKYRFLSLEEINLLRRIR